MSGLTSAWRPIAEGADGIRQILQHLRVMKDYYGSLPSVRNAAIAIAGSLVNNDQAGQIARLTEYVRRAMVYQADPWNSEFTQTPDLLLVQINRRGYAHGDCDDHVLLFASLAESLGIYTEINGVMAPGSSTWNHVIATAYIDDQPVDVDLCAKDGFEPSYPEKLN